MSTLAQELSALKTAEDKITGNKVANFAYDDYAYEHDDANGVDVYNVNNHQNIPNGTANILKVNPTILTKGWRAQASAITRMLLDHFLGRCSYNLNKVNDHFSSLLTTLGNYLGVANGIATLDDNGYVPTTQLSPTGVVKTVNSHTPNNGNVDVTKADVGLGSVVNTGDSATPVSGGTTKFTTGGAYTELAKKAPNNHASADSTYGLATRNLYGHVKRISGMYLVPRLSASTTFPTKNTYPDFDYALVNNFGSKGIAVKFTVPSSNVKGVRIDFNNQGRLVIDPVQESGEYNIIINFPANSTSFIFFSDSAEGYASFVQGEDV